MDYKKAYNEALERARQVHTTNVDENKKSTEYIFPELAESENERIRKAIKYCIKQGFIGHGRIEDVIVDDCLAWLEKQGEEEINDDDKAILENWESIVKENREKWQLSDWFVKATYLLIQKVKHANTGMQGEQKPADSYKESEDELAWLKKYIEEEAYSLSMDIRDNEDRIKLKKLQKALAWLEKQGEHKEYTFKSIPRLLDMIKPTERAKAYCQKLIDTLAKEGYSTDAKIVEDCLKQMNGEVVAMAVMDEKQGEQETEEKI